MVAIGNPIRGYLHPNTWVRPAGNTDMKVTKTAAQHLTTGPAALDIGDGAPDLDDILAPRDSVVAQALTVGSANLSLDFTAEGKQWRIVLAHNTLPHPVALNQRVTEGQVIGRMGATGATAIHLHIQLGYLVGTAYVWVDPWPYLRQNGAVDEEVTDMLKGANPVPVFNRKASVKGDNTRFRAGPSTAEPILAEFDVPTEVAPAYIVEGGAVGGNVKWYAAFGNTAKGKELGYLHVSTVSELVPIEEGYSEKDLADAKKTAANVVSAAADAAASKF